MYCERWILKVKDDTTLAGTCQVQFTYLHINVIKSELHTKQEMIELKYIYGTNVITEYPFTHYAQMQAQAHFTQFTTSR